MAVLSLLQRGLFFAIVLLFGSNWFIKLSQGGLVDGLRVDYLIPRLYFSDLLILGYLSVTALLWMTQRSRPKIKLGPMVGVILVLAALLGFRQLFTPFPSGAMAFLLQSVLHAAFFFCVFKQPPRINDLKLGLILALTWQSLLGLFQFFTQQPLFGYTFFGEPAIDTALNLARGDFWLLDVNLGTRLGLRVLPYGTFPHPNILAGFLVSGMLSLLLLSTPQSLKTANRSWPYTYFIFGAFSLLWTVCLFLTQSLTAFVALGLGLTFLKKRPHSLLAVVIGLFLSMSILLPIFRHTLEIQNTSITRRSVLTVAAMQLFHASPVWGVGIQQFSVFMEDVLKTGEPVRFVQPVHNVVLLLGAETGLLGLVLVALLAYLLLKRQKASVLYVVAVLSPILFFDHYLVSIAQGQLIIGFLLFSCCAAELLSSSINASK